MAKGKSSYAHQKRLQALTKRIKRRTAGITVEHRNSWGDELRCNQSQRALAEATAMNRSWLVIITIYWEDPFGVAYKDDYKFEFQSCTLCDEKSIIKFDALRDHILSEEKAKGNEKHYKDWGWFGTPWESKHKYCDPDDEIIVASFEKE